jgi:hypothetical protein
MMIYAVAAECVLLYSVLGCFWRHDLLMIPSSSLLLLLNAFCCNLFLGCFWRSLNFEI